MHTNAALIDRFYESFAKKDGDAMAACYAPDATFSDPVFTKLAGPEVGSMWKMLCTRSTDLAVRHSDVTADDAGGSCKWQADYTFSQTKRFVQNRIHARFTFEGGLIKTHVDTFSLHKWTSMALGAKGTFLGWLPFVQNAVRAQADRGLRVFMKAQTRGKV